MLENFLNYFGQTYHLNSQYDFLSEKCYPDETFLINRFGKVLESENTLKTGDNIFQYLYLYSRFQDNPDPAMPFARSLDPKTAGPDSSQANYGCATDGPLTSFEIT